MWLLPHTNSGYTLNTPHIHTHWQVTLTAAGTSKNSTKVTLKTPTVGVAAGANMVQTIFSDYAPAAFPNKEVRE